MKTVIVRYKVKKESIQQNIKYIQDVFSALKRSNPAGLRYATFQLEDETSFLHIASIETEDGSNPLSIMEEFKAFTQDIASRCEDPPVAMVANPIGLYQLFN